MTITALPTPPSRDDPANFATRADAFLGALPDFATEANALAAAVNADEIAADASATAAASSASAAASSASAASASASAAAASYDSFDDRYLGAKSSDPSVDNDGNALITGALYFNTTANEMRVYSGSAWVASYLPAGSYLTLTGGTMTGNITFAAGQSFDASKITGSVAIANGGTGANLTDPNADRILFWDDSASAFTFLEAGTGLSISGTTLSASGGASISAGDSNVTVSDTGSNGTVTVQTDGSERMRITSGGNLLVGTTTNNASGGVIQVSNGITFPATQSASSDANTLDDYEEGTWTPNVGGTATYTTQTASYTKIGNTVVVWGEITINLIGTGSTTRVYGLPFTSNGSYVQPGSTGYFANLAQSVYSMTTAVEPGTTNLVFHTQTSLSGTNNINQAVLGNSARIQFSVTYKV